MYCNFSRGEIPNTLEVVCGRVWFLICGAWLKCVAQWISIDV